MFGTCLDLYREYVHPAFVRKEFDIKEFWYNPSSTLLHLYYFSL